VSSTGEATESDETSGVELSGAEGDESSEAVSAASMASRISLNSQAL
jgi:hypothetical protein